jgi:hypothetical protein
MVNLSGRGLSLTTKIPVPVGTAVRIDVNDNILLGEVCHSSESGPSEFVCGVRLEQALTAVHDLSRLVSGLMGASQPRVEKPVEPVEVSKERRRLNAIVSRF